MKALTRSQSIFQTFHPSNAQMCDNMWNIQEQFQVGLITIYMTSRIRTQPPLNCIPRKGKTA